MPESTESFYEGYGTKMFWSRMFSSMSSGSGLYRPTVLPDLAYGFD